jgi:hypothetical protein
MENATIKNKIWSKDFFLYWNGIFVSKLGDQAHVIAATLWGTYFLNSGIKVSLIR